MHIAGLLVAAVVRPVVGMLWYSDLLFRKRWQRLSGITPEHEKDIIVQMLVVGLLGSFVMAVVLERGLLLAHVRTVTDALSVATVNWLGFIAVPLLAGTIHEKKPFALFLIQAGFHLAALLAMAGVLFAFFLLNQRRVSARWR